MGRCARLTGAEGSESPVYFLPMERLENGLDRGIKIRLHIAIPETQDAITSRSQKIVAPSIVGSALNMLTSIQFDDDPALHRGEVADVEPNLMLSPKFETAKLSATKTAPQ